jgi:outer membrane protein
MRIRRVFVLGALSLLLPFAAAGTASAAPEMRIGYVDIQKALSSSSAGKTAQKKYEEEVKRLQGKLDEKKSDFEKLQQSYQKQKDSLNEKARRDKEEELLSREKELKRTFQDSQEALRRKNAQLVGELVEKLKKVVDEFGKDEGYTVILEKGSQSVLYADGKIDVTDSIVRKFDSATK